MKPLLLLTISSLLKFALVLVRQANYIDALWLPFLHSPSASRGSCLHSTIQADEDTSSADVRRDGRKNKNGWFPIRPADALSPSNGYDSLVKSAYLRHILVASDEMADLILEIYLKGGSLPGNDEMYGKSDGDVFTRLARDVSLCVDSREDGGKIGWVDNPRNMFNDDTDKEGTNKVAYGKIDFDLIQRVFRERVKGGDIVKLQTTDGSGWHLIRVDDLHIDVQPSTLAASGSKNVINKNRNKLKGLGIIPLSPKFQKRDVDNYSGIENDDEQSRKIFSVPNAQVSPGRNGDDGALKCDREEKPLTNVRVISTITVLQDTHYWLSNERS